MKITNVKMDMFYWKSEPWKVGLNFQTFGSTQKLGVVTVETDEGITGIAPLGSDRVKEFFPLLEGRDPREVFSIWKKMIDFVFKQGDEGDIVLTFFDHDKKRLHFKLELYEKEKQTLSATIEMLSLYIDLNQRKVAEFEDEKIKIMDEFINKNKSEFSLDNLVFSGKLKK
mgnify:CR=1 FL=1